MNKLRRRVYEYTVFFEKNENGGYTVTAPALPGLVTEGKDLEHARAMAEDAIRCYVEGLRKLKEAVPEEREVVQMRLSVRV
jgi:antitoxin HicB